MAIEPYEIERNELDLEIIGLCRRLPTGKCGILIRLNGQEVYLSPAVFQCLVLITRDAFKHIDGQFSCARIAEEVFISTDAFYRRLKQLNQTLEELRLPSLTGKLIGGLWSLKVPRGCVSIDWPRLQLYPDALVRSSAEELRQLLS